MSYTRMSNRLIILFLPIEIKKENPEKWKFFSQTKVCCFAKKSFPKSIDNQLLNK
ncbi:hypothetical protein SANA_08980 [Gottschalkiaceae bacterium SANA]|nr:hypothetical protein SANA_08980 [Gottschalkiaceae bacterium SANA]